MIWYKKYTLNEVNKIFDNYMTKLLEIKAIEIQKNTLICSMPITDKVRQPFGILHGGASVVLAESAGSIASNMVIDNSKYIGVGLEVNANHIKSGIIGTLIATCKSLHIGNKTHVWDIQIHDHEQNLICVSRLTVAIIAKK